MARCAFIKPGGERCGATAMRGYDHCYGYRPDLAEERRRNASKGGKSGGRGRPAAEMDETKRRVRAVIAGVLSGKIERGVGAVLFQGYNTLLKAVEVERKMREEEELLARIEQLEQIQDQKGGSRWGA